MKIDMRYDGRMLTWNGHGTFKATSGLPDYQYPSFQCYAGKGPIPEGTYSITLREDTHPARNDGTDTCMLAPSSRLQTIPRGTDAGQCEPFWVNWGRNRIGLHPTDPTTKGKCSPRRGGFYLHDSTKGYTHGCIEVEGRFFEALRAFGRGTKRLRLSRTPVLTLRVQYAAGLSTNGGTRQL